MYKSTLVVALLFVVFLVQGILLTWNASGVPRFRLIGIFSFTLCLLLGLTMNMKIGIIAPSAPAPRQEDPGGNIRGDEALHRAVVAAVAPDFKEQGQVGLVVATIVDGRQDITTFGTTAINSSISPRGNTLFEIGSITKLFTAGLLAAAIEQGEVSLDSRVVDGLGLNADPDPRQREVTLRHLATHTAGMPRMSLDIFRPSLFLATMAGGNPYAFYSAGKVKDIFSRTRLQQPPGEHFNYSNIGYGVLGLLLSERAGIPYEQLIQDKIAQSLGQHDTTCRPDAAQARRLAVGYRGYFRLGPLYLAQTAAPSDFGEGLVGAGGLRSTGQDMLRFMTAQMRNKAPSPSTFLRRTHPILFSKDATKIGMGWVARELPRSRQGILFHDGISGGYASFIGISDDDRFGVVLLGNVSRSMNTLGYALLDALATDFPLTPGLPRKHE
jgi:CubicO group peptidase (beta-lactamase class C family)